MTARSTPLAGNALPLRLNRARAARTDVDNKLGSEALVFVSRRSFAQASRQSRRPRRTCALARRESPASPRRAAPFVTEELCLPPSRDCCSRTKPATIPAIGISQIAASGTHENAFRKGAPPMQRCRHLTAGTASAGARIERSDRAAWLALTIEIVANHSSNNAGARDPLVAEALVRRSGARLWKRS